MAECHLHTHSGEYRRWYNVVCLVVPEIYCMNYLIIWKGSRIDIYVYLLVDLFDELFGNEMMRLWRLSIILEFFNSLYMLLVFVNSRPVNCDSLMELGQSSTSAKLLSISRGMLETSEFCEPMCFGVLHWSFQGVSRTNLVSIFVENFYNVIFWLRLVRNDGLDSVCQNSFLRCGQVNSVLCILLRSSMKLMIRLPRFLCICYYLCFAGIVVETCQQLWRKCLSSFCTSVYTFFTLFSFCYQSRFCNGVMILCSIRGVDEFYSCKESSTWLFSLGGIIISACGLRIIYRFEASAVKAMRPILKRGFSFQLILGFCTLTRSQYWKYNIPIRCSRFFSVTSTMCRSRHTWRWGSRRNVFCTSVIRRVPSFCVIWLCSRVYWHGIAAAAAAAAAAFRGGRVLPASWRKRFPDARLKIHLRFNVVWILWTILVIFHGSKFSSFCETMHRNCPYSCFHRSPLWSLCTAPRWCVGWECFSPFTSAASEEFSTLDIALANIFPDVLVLLNVADVHQCNKVDFPYLLCLCAFFLTSFHSFSIAGLDFGQHCSEWKIFYSYFSVSRGMRLWETDLQSLLNHT